MVASQTSQAQISWCQETSASLGYVVRYGTNPSDLNQFKNIAANLSSTVISGLTDNIDYYFTVEGRNDRGSGDSSELIKVRPGAAILPDFGIESVTFNQGVQLDLTTGTSSIPAVAGKTGILRMFLNASGPVDGLKAKVQLNVTHNTLPLTPILQEVVLFDSAKSASEEFIYPVFFELSGSYVDAGNSFSIIIDPDNDLTESDENNNRFPVIR